MQTDTHGHTHTDTHKDRHRQRLSLSLSFSFSLSVLESTQALEAQGERLPFYVPISPSGCLAPLPCHPTGLLLSSPRAALALPAEGREPKVLASLPAPALPSAVALKVDMQARFFSPRNDFLNNAVLRLIVQ